jgi:hypothetical protein
MRQWLRFLQENIQLSTSNFNQKEKREHRLFYKNIVTLAIHYLGLSTAVTIRKPVCFWKRNSLYHSLFTYAPSIEIADWFRDGMGITYTAGTSARCWDAQMSVVDTSTSPSVGTSGVCECGHRCLLEDSWDTASYKWDKKNTHTQNGWVDGSLRL